MNEPPVIFPQIKGNFDLKWHYRFLTVSKLVAEWSNSPFEKSACIFVNPKKRMVSLGYSGLPSGVENYEVGCASHISDNVPPSHLRDYFIRAEENAILCSDDLLDDSYAYFNKPINIMEASSVINVGIKGVFCPAPHNTEDQTYQDYITARNILEEAKVFVYCFETSALEIPQNAMLFLNTAKKYSGQQQWDYRYFSLAKVIKTWSKDPSTQVGAVIADKNNHFVSSGYNGFAANVTDRASLYQDRAQKYTRVIHAEKNAIMQASKRRLSGATLYATLFPCLYNVSDDYGLYLWQYM